MKKSSKLSAAFLSAALVVFTAMEPLTAFAASKAKVQEIAPTPVSSSGNNSEAKEFRRVTPVLSGQSSALSWEKINHAMCYRIYVKNNDNGSYKLLDTTFDTVYGYVDNGTYKIRAITFSYDDKIVFSGFSNEVTIGDYVNSDDYDYEYVDEEYSEDNSGDIQAGEGVEISDVGTAEAVSGVSYDEEPEFNTEEYSNAEESGYKSVKDNPLSTFSADVDTASYANMRRMITDFQDVPASAVRIEEMLNYFDYSYPEPKDNEPFSISTELSDCPWNSSSKLLMIGINGKDIPKSETPNSNLVFLIDTSGSMSSKDKLELVKKSLNMLTETLTSKDRISIVTYSGYERVVLEGAKGNQKNTVSTLTSFLDAEGWTNGESGINLAYKIAEKYYIEGGNNRIILATDGDLNVGISSESELKKLVEEKRKSGVNLSVLGFGYGNIKDNKMETLADNGNGSYHYIDTAKEACKVLVEERNSTLVTIAKDVKLQVEFNPAYVKGYRLIGYDNRRLESEDFTNDTKDAGDVGAGCTVTALYEIVPISSKKEISSTKLKYGENSDGKENGEWLTVNVRYKEPDGTKSMLVSKTVSGSSYNKKMSSDMTFACAVTEFGLILKSSDYMGSASIEDVRKLLTEANIKDDYYKTEFNNLVEIYYSCQTDEIIFE